MSRAAPLLALIFVALLFAAACAEQAAPPPAITAAASPAGYVDEALCAQCHAQEAQRWQGSDHDLAMQPATAQTVLGSFDGKKQLHHGVETRLATQDGRFVVETERPDGKRGEFEVTDVFGVDPLQQLLVQFPDGRKQAFALAWDVQRERWFHVYGDERIDAADERHWSRPAQNWNYMCAECHATGLVRGWDESRKAYDTRAERFDVGCQACHGPAAGHVDWLNRRQLDPQVAESDATRGFPIDLGARDSEVEVENCARCHARRAPLADGFRHASRLMDDYLPALLDEGLYHADGQILEEVYEYGSFLQSRMHAAGMRCSDCHDPHSSRLKATGDTLCITCHNEGVPAARKHVQTIGLVRKDYDSPTHHFHAQGQPGSACVDCHAPARTYMQIDPRRDHSFRVPRPDLTVSIGTPNACNGCHSKETPQWAADAAARWWGTERRKKPHWGEAFHAGRTGQAGAVQRLLALYADAEAPAIVRATAIELLARYPGAPVLLALEDARKHPDPLVRNAAVAGFELLSPRERIGPLTGLLSDPVRAVRLEAARALAPARPGAPAGLDEVFDRALAEYEACQKQLFERPEGHANLGSIHATLGRYDEAERELRAALQRDPAYVAAWANLADMQRARGDETAAEETLREALKWVPESAALHHALGLALVRQHKPEEVLAELGRAARLDPSEPRFGYVYAIALEGVRGRQAARGELEGVLQRHAWHRDTRLALVAWCIEDGDAGRAQELLQGLAAINPYDPALSGRR